MNTRLPTGTVSLLFSDIESSTALLRRLGARYAEALDGQRRILRTAWADHGGTELGTEGDSFFVVFSTAEAAVAAAVQAQRDLAGFEWPAGERVRVRMGVHTGAPALHDGGYVGMDVHRAARIAAAAHGGQVVVSSTAAELSALSLPAGVRLLDLGSHQLKDIAVAEHLFQLVLEGLQADFPPLKTLGAASSLPRPATPLVGRDGELAELAALLASPDVRLVTLTGPGGSGKTRLAVCVAERLVKRFSDGVFFVPLAAATTAEVMWTSIGEVLDVPPEGRIPPGFFTHVAHRSALFVLDNLEQVVGADDVVAQLLDAAPEVVVIATSRRPLNLGDERQHAVPPLELPEQPTPEQAAQSGAVQLFIQQARAVKASFALDAGNVAAVVEVCRRLDGLPLAIELAAARTKLLSPSALLARLDKALDIAAAGHRAPSRQKTLRNTIGWSYDLLDSDQQMFFRRLGVFAGGADLDAITAVTTDLLDGADPLDLLGELVDASLATMTEDHRGEPRVGMLVTIRAYAQDQLQLAGELDDVRRGHAMHCLTVVEQLSPLIWASAEQSLAARRRFEVDLDNIREALSWALQPDDLAACLSSEQVRIGRSLCAESLSLWSCGGYYAEAGRWLERAISVTANQNAAEQDSVELSRCLRGLSAIAMGQGDFSRAHAAITQTVAMLRRLGDQTPLVRALCRLAFVELQQRDSSAARASVGEAVTLATELGDSEVWAETLGWDADVESYGDNFGRALELYTAAVASFVELGHESEAIRCRYEVSCVLRRMGRLEESHRQFSTLIPQVLQLWNPDDMAAAAEDYGAVLAELGAHQRATRLLGAADAMRERNRTPRSPLQQHYIEEPHANARAALPAETWEREYQAGRNMTAEAALTEARAATTDLDR